MRCRLMIMLLVLSASALLLVPPSSAPTQPPQDKKKKGPDKTADFAGWAAWEFKRKDANGDGFLDPDEMYSSLRDELERWDVNKDKKIDYREFTLYLQGRTRERLDQERQKWGGKGEEVAAWAEKEFARRDRNEDGYLDKGEMPGSLRDELERWDRNADGKISPEEYRAHLQARVREKLQQAEQQLKAAEKWVKSAEFEDDDLPPRPVMIRAGNLPKELPPWFVERDTNRDGQVSLAEWFRAGRRVEEFQEVDSNDDGLLTPEEVLRWMSWKAKK
jgi:Ca2+-binding EF-hand superfamily protein